MCEFENNIKLSWLLVSQFVSWDFCRYMCEQNENETWEPDVLTFLRNMVVERTEKAASDITKHEMVARFVMEARTIRTIARMPFIQELSKKVIEKCPELKSAVANLLFDLQRLLNSFEESKDPQKREKILITMTREVNKFNAEACKNLPLPNLLQVIQTWLQAEYQAQLLKADIKKNIENVELFQKVVDCLHEEKITSEEAKVIARTLYEDKSLKRIFLLNNSETETDIDSQSQSLSIQPYQVPPRQLTPPQSAHVSSHFKLPSPVHHIEPDNTTRSFTFNPALSSPSPPHLEPANISLHDSFNPSSPEEPLEDVQQYKVSDDVQDLGLLNPTKSYFFKPSTEPQIGTTNFSKKPFMHDIDPVSLCSSDSDSSEITSATSTSRNKRRWKKLLEEFRLEDDFSEDDSPSVSKKTRTPKVVVDSPVQNSFVNCDDEDTSDCDKNADLKFLTPTMFKSDYVDKNPARAVLLSDNESFNSSITTAPTNSQEDDPTFVLTKSRNKAVPAKDSHILPPKKRLKTTKSTAKNKPMSRILARISEEPEAPKQVTLRRFGFAPNAASSVKSATERAARSKKKTIKLFDNDIPTTRSSDESSLFQINTRSSKKKNLQQKTINLGNKKRCEECKTTFRTPTELKKHIFVVHTVEDLSDD
ncbi:uncharacterized protein LOC129988569 isoform X1 [Argiope bruennichi]|uniref:uncharacterized protein LOC129988569 isoform X1 n=1 Tax=Argiope bruennichi TaxID=94029 RepID=UPI0024954C3F|nr:uncharacterized protein LOC129988569 isoform X1 [Argiope bruennichi]